MNHNRHYLTIIIILSSFLLFWKIGVHDLSEWDEARNGVNAYEMYHNGDYVNFYYSGQLDTWNAKPPLLIWLIVLSYKLFGFNEFALRFPSVLSSIFFFIYFFKLIKLLENELTAFLSCLILLPCKAILGNHMGITGDFDALLLFLITVSLYYFICFIEFSKPRAIFTAAIFSGLAFYAKGVASFIYFPGLVLYIFIRNRQVQLIKNYRLWLSLFLFLSIVATWIISVLYFGQKADSSFYGSKNSLETMFLYDTFDRLTSHNFGQAYEPDRIFFFAVIDARLNIWNYIFYISLIAGMVSLFKRRGTLREYINEEGNRAVLLSLCLIVPIAIMLTFATYKHNWYLAPTFPFVAFITAKGVIYFIDKWKPSVYLFTGVFLFAIIRQFIYLNSMPTEMHSAIKTGSNSLKGNTEILVIEQPRQNLYLYLVWNRAKPRLIAQSDFAKYKDQMIILERKSLPNDIGKQLYQTQYFDEYCMGRIK